MGRQDGIQIYNRHVRDVRATADRANRQAREAAGREAASGTELGSPELHGLSPNQVEKLRDRFEKFLPSMAAGAAPRTRASQFFAGLMPDGANLDPNAGAGFANVAARHASLRRSAAGGLPSGATLSGGNGVLQSNQMPYQPEFACFTEGTLVVMADGSRKPIEAVQIGDRVPDRYGREQIVENAWCEGVPEEVVEVRAWGNWRQTATVNHRWPVCVWARTCTCGCGQAVTPGRLYAAGHYKPEMPQVQHVHGPNQHTAASFTAIADDYDPFQKLRSDELRVRDFLLIPRTFSCSPSHVTPEEARLLGYYVAEGHLEYGPLGVYTFGLTFGHGEKDTARADTVNICTKLNIDLTSTMQEGAVRLRATNNRDANRDNVSTRASWFATHGGVYSHSKQLSAEVMSWPIELKRELVVGGLRGGGARGGHYSGAPGKEGGSHSVTLTTVSPTLAGQLQLILAQLGYPSRHVQVPPALHAFPEDRVYDCREAYMIVVPAPFSFDLAHVTWGDDTADQRKIKVTPACMVDDNFVYVPIESVATVPNDKPVYNLTVSGSGSYLVENVATYNSPDRQAYPIHRQLANIYWRLFYKLDPVIGTCVDLFAEMIWSNFQLTGEGVSGEIRDALERMCELTQLRAKLPYFVREFQVIGEVAPHLFWDDDLGLWTHLALHNPDQLEVIHAPFLDMTPIIEFKPDDRLRQVLMSSNPALQALRETMPPELLAAMASGANIPLSPVNCTLIARKLHPYDVRGTSIVSRMWRTLMYEDSIYNAAIAVARRAAAPLKVAKLGDRNTGWIPDPSHERRLLELLVQSETDPAAWLVYNYAIEFDLVGSQDRAWKIEQSTDFIERQKLMAMGVSKAFLQGEVTYASAASGLTVFLQRLKALREFFESVWIYPKFFRPVSEMNRWVKPTEAELSHKVRTRRSQRELREDNRYIMPKIEWNRPLDPSIDSAMINAYQALSGLGVKFSKTTMAALVNCDYESELKKLLEESKQEQELLAQHPELQMAMGGDGDGGGGGGAGGGGVAPGLPPEAMGMEPPMDEGAPPMDEGGGEPPTAAESDNQPHGGTLWDAQGRYGAWAKDEVQDLISLLQDGDPPDDEPWSRMLEDWTAAARGGDRSAFAALHAVKSGDSADAWAAVEEWLIVEGYPPRAVRAVEAILKSEKVLQGEPTKAAQAEVTQNAARAQEVAGDDFFVGVPHS